MEGYKSRDDLILDVIDKLEGDQPGANYTDLETNTERLEAIEALKELKENQGVEEIELKAKKTLTTLWKKMRDSEASYELGAAYMIQCLFGELPEGFDI